MCQACWHGWWRLFQRASHSGLGATAAVATVVVPGAQTYSPAAPEVVAALRAPALTLAKEPALVELVEPEQVSLPNLLNGTVQVKAIEAVEAELPARLLQLDPAIAAIHRGTDTFRREGPPSPSKSTSIPSAHRLPCTAQDSFVTLLTSPPGLATTVLPQPSPASALHGTGKCSPCAWYWKPKSCLNAKGCAFCHLCPEGELKNRKKAKLAARRANDVQALKLPVEVERETPRVLQLSSLL